MKKVLEFSETINRLKKRERAYEKQGYTGDACEMAFRRQVLILLQDLIATVNHPNKKANKRKPSKWNTFCAKHLKEGKTVQEVAKMWRELK